MKLQYTTRSSQKKSESKVLRRDGKIPAILYKRGQNGDPIVIQLPEFEALMRQVKSGHLPTTVFELVGADGKARKCILKEIQYHPVTYAVLHLDFEELIPDVPVNVKVPIELTGLVDCVGVKLGGVVRQVIRHLRVRCTKPADLPQSFALDVTQMQLGDAKRLSDLKIPTTIRSLANLKEVAVVIVKR